MIDMNKGKDIGSAGNLEHASPKKKGVIILY